MWLRTLPSDPTEAEDQRVAGSHQEGAAAGQGTGHREAATVVRIVDTQDFATRRWDGS